MAEKERKLPNEPVPETAPAKKHKKEEEYFAKQEAEQIKKIKEKQAAEKKPK
jgi:hypothetical protein